MDDELAAEGKRLIREALQRDWKPKIRSLVLAIAKQRCISWQEACDVAEFDIVTASEHIKLISRASQHTEDDLIGWELSAQAMLGIIADVRAEESAPGTEW